MALTCMVLQHVSATKTDNPRCKADSPDVPTVNPAASRSAPVRSGPRLVFVARRPSDQRLLGRMLGRINH
jgi:hypothetical protein